MRPAGEPPMVMSKNTFGLPEADMLIATCTERFRGFDEVARNPRLQFQIVFHRSASNSRRLARISAVLMILTRSHALALDVPFAYVPLADLFAQQSAIDFIEF
jgi:hypothetical protein